MEPVKPKIPFWSIFAAIVLATAVGYLIYHQMENLARRGEEKPVSIGGSFELTNHEGRTFTEDDLDGQFYLVYFGYTYCPDICPTALTLMAETLDLLGVEGRDIVPLFVTIDPARDTAEHLKMYVGYFHPRLIGLTGTEEQVAAAAKTFGVFFGRVEDKDDNDDDYLMDHTSIIYLMGPDGRYRTHFSHSAAPEDIAGQIREII
jgi:cytochrome oxidase Cu insertion factor (SCO1/SenC/PrrC family)